MDNPIHLKTREEANAYLAAHLTPAGYSRNGFPIYNQEEINPLNIVLPEDE
jgi:hypothetical protein